jgi:hypothetical protein
VFPAKTTLKKTWFGERLSRGSVGLVARAWAYGAPAFPKAGMCCPGVFTKPTDQSNDQPDG